jgi:hypothetical protein
MTRPGKPLRELDIKDDDPFLNLDIGFSPVSRFHDFVQPSALNIFAVPAALTTSAGRPALDDPAEYLAFERSDAPSPEVR